MGEAFSGSSCAVNLGAGCVDLSLVARGECMCRPLCDFALNTGLGHLYLSKLSSILSPRVSVCKISSQQSTQGLVNNLTITLGIGTGTREVEDLWPLGHRHFSFNNNNVRSTVISLFSVL